MDIKTDYFIITCPEGYKAAAEKLAAALNSRAEDIIRFFRLDGIKEQVSVILYTSAQDYKAHVESCGQTYFDWMIADTFDGRINITTLEVCRSLDSHRDMTEEEYPKLIIHEFVHFCQQQVNPDCRGVIWFWEALAVNLAEQQTGFVQALPTADELMDNYTALAAPYAVSGFLGKYMLNSLPQDKIYQYIANPELLRQDTPEILVNSEK